MNKTGSTLYIGNEKIELFKKLFNYSFNCIDHLNQALISNSLVEEKHLLIYHDSFNRLVFLGENLLSLVISELVYFKFPKGNECVLTTLRTEILNNKTLGGLAIKQGVSWLIALTKGEEKMKIRENNNKIAELLKALFGAIYLDCNKDIDLVKIVILDFLQPILKEVFNANK